MYSRVRLTDSSQWRRYSAKVSHSPAPCAELFPITSFQTNSNIEALIPNFQALQRNLHKIEVLCARLNRQLEEKKENIVDLKINLGKARSYAKSRKGKERYSQLIRDLRRTEKEENALWNRLAKAKADQHKLRKQVTKAR